MGVRCQRQLSVWTRMAALAGSTNIISSRSDTPVLYTFRGKKALLISPDLSYSLQSNNNLPRPVFFFKILLIISQL